MISGQVNALAIHPKDANTVYMGASEGGVWKTSNGGATWTALTDTQLVRKQPSGISKGTLSIGALAIDPKAPQTVYAGTGEPNLACCFAGPGLGVFRSLDGGATWSPTGVDLSQAQCGNAAMSQAVVNRILVVPPVQVRAEIIYPDGHVESVELKPIEGSESFPMNFPKGGSVEARITAEDAGKATSAAESSLELKACPGI